MFKKILASALAVAMLAGMSVTAFAGPVIPEELYNELIDFAKEVNGKVLLQTPAGEDSYNYNDLIVLDKDNQPIFDENNNPITIKDAKPGDKLAAELWYVDADDAEEMVDSYIEERSDIILENYAAGDITAIKEWYISYTAPAGDAGPAATTSEQVKGYKLDILFDKPEGEELVEKVVIEPFHLGEGDVIYTAIIYLRDDVEAIDPEDLVGNLIVYKNSKSNIIEGLQERPINGDKFATVGYDSIGYDQAGFEEITGEGNGAPVRDFSDAVMNETAELYFEGVGYFFTGDVGTEGRKYLAFNYTPDYELLAKYPTADMEFINFRGKVAFNQFGSFELFKEPDQFAYAVVDGELVTLESIARFGKVVDGEDEGYSVVLQLKNFPESFVLSDTELELTEAVAEEVVEAVDAEPAA